MQTCKVKNDTMILFSFLVGFLVGLMTWEAHLKFIGKVILGKLLIFQRNTETECFSLKWRKGCTQKTKLQNRLCTRCEYKDVYGRQNFNDWWVTGNGITQHTFFFAIQYNVTFDLLNSSVDVDLIRSNNLSSEMNHFRQHHKLGQFHRLFSTC